MELQDLITFFGYMSLINFGVLLFSFTIITISGKWVHRLHGKIFNIPEETVGKSLYLTIAFYKILIILFNVVPWIVLKLMA
ncbi:MAG: hypothetical protein HRU50_05020 [Winogradskyella sp.]|uniref:DUF6868 family protein n=1 Tax=Winogradskyella sp. TaxID=1883156 RepID=UPI0025F9EF5A|nr:hypothetical protein [Winogradskyella sp.]NRB59289.1 hypothetical protein [Winogradskyella sp.]